MKSQFSTKWKSSKQPRKQRKYAMNAPLHTRGKFLTAPLSEEMQKKVSAKKARIRTGDKVKVMTGSFKGDEGKVQTIDLNSSKVTVEGVERTKKDGSKTSVKIHASNLLITDALTSDKKRFKTSNK
jgi:large subunit ribosomal protein L24